VEFIRIIFLAGRKMFLAAANKPIFLSNPYPFRAEHQPKVQTHAKVSIYNGQGEME
jgi:hypothetical protein